MLPPHRSPRGNRLDAAPSIDAGRWLIRPAFGGSPRRLTVLGFPRGSGHPAPLDEALALKAERPDAVPIQGGTDVMVELNFDRARPETILNLNEVGDLRGWSRANGRYGSDPG